MSTGRQDPAKAGSETARMLVTRQADAGMSADRIAEHQQDTAAGLFSNASTDEGRAFAREYDRTTETLCRELREMERGPEPDRTPGAEHPDHPGWRACAHGIFRRDRQAEADMDPEAA